MAVQPVQTIFDHSDQVVKGLKALANKRVMVGIPAKDAERREKGPTNAALGYWHEFGIPENNLPARPFLRPGVASVQQNSIRRLKQAASAALHGNDHAMMSELRAAGQEAASAVQQKITDGPFEPLAPSTIRARERKLLGTTALTPSQRAAGFADIKPLIDTGQLRASITYVIRDRGRDIA
jgi:hypothetical protein